MAKFEATKTGLKALPEVETRTVFFDTGAQAVRGLGLRVSPPSKRHPKGNRVWILEYRTAGSSRTTPKQRVVLAPGSLDPSKARIVARDMLADIRQGSDPAAERKAAREADTVEELIAKYLDEEIKPHRKARTYELYEAYVRRHISPRTEGGRLSPGAIGGKSTLKLTRAEVSKFHRTLGATHRMTANRCVTLIGAAYSWAIKEEILKDGFRNPARSITKYPENKRERYLTTEEFARLGEALRLAETEGIPWNPDPEKPKANRAAKEENRRVVFDQWSVGAIRLLIFTGCRLREILNLRWAEVDLERGMLFLPDSKTGRKSVILSAPALEVLAGLDRVGAFVIAGESAGSDEERPRADLQRPWARITKHAGLEGLRLHDLRHSFASVGAAGGLGLPIVGRLLGHKDTATTARYAHIADDPARRAANAIAGTIKAALGGQSGTVIPFRGGAE